MGQESHLELEAEATQLSAQLGGNDWFFNAVRLVVGRRLTTQAPDVPEREQCSFERSRVAAWLGDVEGAARPQDALDLAEAAFDVVEMVEEALGGDDVELSVFGLERPDVTETEAATSADGARGGLRLCQGQHFGRVVDSENVEPSVRQGDTDDAGSAAEIERARRTRLLGEPAQVRLEEIAVVDGVLLRHLPVI